MLFLQKTMGFANDNFSKGKKRFPDKEVIDLSTLDYKKPEVVDFVNLNTMTNYKYSYKDGIVEVTMKNEPNEANLISWKKQGKYDKRP